MSCSRVPSSQAQRMSALYRRNLRHVGRRDVVVACTGGAGQSLVGNILIELMVNYQDAYTEELASDGTSRQLSEHVEYRRRLAALRHHDSAGGGQPLAGAWPRFVKTHFPAEVFASVDLMGTWLVVRDPRDTLFSLHAWRRTFAEMPWDQVPESFAAWLQSRDGDGRTPVDVWRDFYAGWQESADPDKIAVTRFEDLKREPVITMARALAVFGVGRPLPQIELAAARSSFEAMRGHEDRIAHLDTRRPAGARMLREGKVDGWRTWMTPELAACFEDARTRGVAARFGYELDGGGHPVEP